MLSLDLDGDHLAELARSDLLLGALVARAPGLRPVLFGSPYEGAAAVAAGVRADNTVHAGQPWTAGCGPSTSPPCRARRWCGP